MSKGRKVSDGMIVAMYQKMLQSGEWNKTNIIKRFKGADYIKAGVKHKGTGVRSAYGMRKKEALEIMRELERTNSEAKSLMERIDNSDLYENKSPGFRDKIQKDALKVARREAYAVSERGRRTGRKAGSVWDMRSRMLKNVDANAEYVVFYS